MKISKIALVLAAISAISFFNSCKPKIPAGATAVQNFEPEKYLGKWFEIARMDYKQERNLNNVTAVYTLKDDGTIKVENRGYNYKDKKWEDVTGEARFVNKPSEGRLKVSFFKPFWSGYNVIDQIDYQYALVAGDNLNYLWILERTAAIPGDVKQRFLTKAKSLGYKTEELIWVEHNQ